MIFTLHLGILSNSLLLYILWKNARKELHFKVLFIIFLWILFTQISFLGFINESKIIFYAMFLFQDTLPTSVGPCLYLYVKTIFFPSKHVFKNNYKHFIIPFLYLLFASIPKLISLINSSEPFTHLRIGLENLWALSNIYSLIYCILALIVLSKTKKLVKFYYSNINSKDLDWLQIFLYGTIVIIGIDISITIYEVLFGDITSAIGIIAVFVVFLIVYLAYKGISQTKVLLPEFLLKKEDAIHEQSTEESRLISHQTKITHDPEELDILFKRLEIIIREQKCYLTPELSLKSVSEKLNISDKKLSYLLNQHMNVSFYDYVNQFRVEEVKKKIMNPSFSKYTLLAIALECGFNSKTSFNRTFQRFEKITPSKFRTQVLKSKSNYDLTEL